MGLPPGLIVTQLIIQLTCLCRNKTFPVKSQAARCSVSLRESKSIAADRPVSASNNQLSKEEETNAMNRGRALKWASGLLIAVFAFRIFYFQELFFAFLLFAAGYLVLLLLVGVVLCFWDLYARGMASLAAPVDAQCHRVLPLLRVLVLWLAPTAAKAGSALLVCLHALFGPIQGLAQGWLLSFRVDAALFRKDTERAVEQLRLLLKQS